jgi:hypothetical protein
MEGLTITPDQKTLVGIMQSTMYNPSKAVKNLDITRIVTVNLETGEIGQYLYKQDKTQKFKIVRGSSVKALIRPISLPVASKCTMCGPYSSLIQKVPS